MLEASEQLGNLVEHLSARVRELEQRVAVLENRQSITAEARAATSPATPAAPAPAPLSVVSLPIQRGKPPATWRGFPPPEKPGGSIAVAGKAVLGIAGAYLLRAIAESGSLPKLPVLVLAIAYACGWMLWAVRNHAGSRFASISYAITSVLIFSPLMWESTIRFHSLSAVASGGVLVGFIVLTIALAWREDLQAVPWIATTAAVVTAVALLIETRELVPMTAALLGIALAVEAAACFDRQLMLRYLAAMTADLAVAVLVFFLPSSDGVPEAAISSSPQMVGALSLALLAIYGASIAFRVFVKARTITVFEIVQAVLAFVIGTAGTLLGTHMSAAPALGVAFLLMAGACYWGALSRFIDSAHDRNRRVLATWAALLLIGGSLMCLPLVLVAPFLCVAAIASAWMYTRTGKYSLGLHASLYLAAASSVSALPAYLVNALALKVPGAPAWSVWLIVISAAACYGIGARHVEQKRRRRLLWLLPALIVGFSAAALSVSAIVAISGGRLDSPSSLSVVRTLVNCGFAIALAYLGSLQKRVELGWVAYTAVVFGTLKLLFEDLRLGNAVSLVFSLLFYGSVLILLPKLMQKNRALIES